MKFKKIDHYMSGISVPVSALRSETGCGIGEFKDLKTFAGLCKKTGIELIQLLPVNDSGYQHSPYSALSAYALHPIYLHLQDIKGSEAYKVEIEKKAAELNKSEILKFDETLRFKLSLLEKVFDDNYDSITRDAALKKFTEENTWLKSYAVFLTLRKKNGNIAWHDWPELQNPTKADIDKVYKKEKKQTLFYIWLQHNAHLQFKAAADFIDKNNILLKGDLPILMNEDSADVWAHRENFNLDLRAGAPPDMFSDLGQNWDFPIYDWHHLANNDYAWWKTRLKVAGNYYHSYRIDHVLGFFRIWCIPSEEKHGLLGFMEPYEPVTRQELLDAGFDEGRITWLSMTHIPEEEIDSMLAQNADNIKDTMLDRVGNEPLFHIKSEYRGERAIIEQLDDENSREFLLYHHRNRTLLKTDNDTFYPHWKYYETRGWETLTDDERSRLQKLLEDKARRSEEIWDANGRRLLQVMKDTTKMLVCAEDLGAVPACVGPALEDLGILSLKIERWVRRYHEQSAPFVDPNLYPVMSVCTPSVHDTSTIRGWWQEQWDQVNYWPLLGFDEEMPEQLETRHLEAILKRNRDSGSVLSVFQVQEFLSLVDRYASEDPEKDRINIPGTVNDTNWMYRLPVTIETLLNDSEFTKKVSGFTAIRADKKLDSPIEPQP